MNKEPQQPNQKQQNQGEPKPQRQTQQGQTQQGQNQGDQGGEGNYDASRRYREGLEGSVKKGNSEELAEEAKKALDGKEGDDLRRAEELGKKAETPGT